MNDVPAHELSIGISAYASVGPPCAATMRSVAQDFRVEEAVHGLEVSKEWSPESYPLYRVEKRSIDTLHMAEELGEALKSRLAFAGLKDKRAVAVQYVTPTTTKSLRPALVVRDRFRAELVGFVRRPLSRGMVHGNRFAVVLRQCCPEMPARIEETFALAGFGRIPNFYGVQRFGAQGAGTHEIGREIVKGDFECAVRVLLTKRRPGDDDGAAQARAAMAEGRYSEARSMLPVHQDVERMVAGRLARRPLDWIGAIRAVPLKLRRLYVEAYQSFLFNRSLSAAMKRGLDIAKRVDGDNWCVPSEDGLAVGPVRGVRDAAPANSVPMLQLVGFAYRDYGSRFDSCVEEVMAEEGISAKEFYVKEMQEVSAEGGFRRTHLVVRDQESRWDGGTAEVRFTLARGQYATTLLREVVKPASPAGYGLA